MIHKRGEPTGSPPSEHKVVTNKTATKHCTGWVSAKVFNHYREKGKERPFACNGNRMERNLAKMELMRYSELTGHDVCQFSYSFHVDEYWSKDSLYVDSSDFFNLYKSIDQVIENFHYYGPQKVTISEWNKIRQISIKDNPSLECFFNEIDFWITQDPQKNDWFWIYGV